MPQPTSENPYESPHAAEDRSAHASGEGDATGGVIPYKKLPALMAYYLGLLSLLPCVGIVPAIAALILGIKGLRARAANPAIRGSIHAWIGVVLGGLFTLIWGGLAVFILLIAFLG